MDRKIRKVLMAQPTLEGAGVHLHRAFGYHDIPDFDPFLMLDDFRNDDPARYLAGFPWHPHRGIETITYMLKGSAEHGDSMGNKGTISAGDVQWMTAGSGIIHQEMPKPDQDGKMYGFQLWANLPAAQKMMNPRYRDVKAGDLGLVELEGNVRMKIISGTYDIVTGPVKDIVIDPQYFDIHIPQNTSFTLDTHPGYKCLVYIYEGECRIDAKSLSNRQLVLFEDGDSIQIQTENNRVQFLFLSGKPLDEPIAWRGPIVMNTEDELDIAFREYHNGTFIK